MGSKGTGKASATDDQGDSGEDSAGSEGDDDDGEDDGDKEEGAKRPGGRLLPKGLVDFGDSGDDGSD